jgi:uncharacterized protein (DUF58 family)
MQLTQQAYVLIAAAAILAVADLWSAAAWLSGLWCVPLLMLGAGFIFEGVRLRDLHLTARLDTRQPVFAGRPQPAAFVLDGDAPATLEYLRELPPSCAPDSSHRRLRVSPGNETRDDFLLTAVRFGEARCPDLTVRVRGPLQLAWWPRALPVSGVLRVLPAITPLPPGTHGTPGGRKALRVPGAGQQLYQLRAYRSGDRLAHIDWKATVRTGGLITRAMAAEPQHDLVLLLDAGHGARGRLGGTGLERHALQAGVAATVAHSALARDERVGLMLFADRPLGAVAPGRGWATLTRICTLLAQVTVQPGPSDPVAAALAVRRLAPRRAAIVLVTDLADESLATPLSRAVQVLRPTYQVILAGLEEPRIAAMGRAPAQSPADPWIALAAQEHLAQAQQLKQRLRQLGCPVVTAPPGRLEELVSLACAGLATRRPRVRAPVSSATMKSQ